MDIHTKAVHAGDRRKAPAQVPVTTPVYTAASFFCESMEELDRIFAREQNGYCYSRYENPTNTALEEQVTALEGGMGALACASGMAALQVALTAALMDRRKAVLAAQALYGASISLLNTVMEPFGVDVRYVDACDLAAVERAIQEHKPGCVLLETVSNPMLRVPEIDRIARLARTAGATVVVDNTFATPLLVRPLELGAGLVVHSATKYLSGHGDVLGGLVVADAEHIELVRSLARAYGPVLGPFESYLTMRGVKTLPLRMERQCANACRIAQWLAQQAAVERVHYLADPQHPDRRAIDRLLPQGLYGAMISFELRNAGRDDVLRFMNRLKLIVRATSLGDVHTMMLYPAMSSHREVSPRQRDRMGIRDNLVRLSVGIESPDDICEDLRQAMAAG